MGTLYAKMSPEQAPSCVSAGASADSRRALLVAAMSLISD